MTDALTVVEVNCATNEVTERPLTAEEITQREADAIVYAEQKAIQEAEAEAKAELKASARAKLISGTPLTEEEAAVLVI
jgi:hypothetical protein